MKRSEDLWPRKSKPDPARAGLLDRLVDNDLYSDEEPRPKRTYDRDELFLSIIKEIDRVLNTRCIVPKKTLKNRQRSVVDFGVADTTGMNTLALDDHITITRSIKEAITRYEPRLQQVQVSVDPVAPNERSLVVRIDGMVQLDHIREPVSFPVVIKSDTGQVTVNAQ